MAFGEKFEGKKHEKHESKKHEKKEHGHKEQLKGGKGDNIPDKAFPKKELKKGMKHESEHTPKKGVEKEIAKDHLVEDKGYYKKIDKMEKQPKKPLFGSKKETEEKIDDKDYYGSKEKLQAEHEDRKEKESGVEYKNEGFAKAFENKKSAKKVKHDEKDQTSSGLTA